MAVKIGSVVEILTTFASISSLTTSELSELLELLQRALHGSTTDGDRVGVGRPNPAVSIAKSVTPDYLICLDDGKRFKFLRGHLARLNMTPEQYRSKWGLPPTYPMVAPNYAALRSAMSKDAGFGKARKQFVSPPTEGETKR